MILDPRLLSIVVLAFHKVPAKPLPQDADSENFGLLNILEIPLNIAGSILKATNDTTPLLIENLDSVRSTAPLAITFAEALFEEQREQNRKVFATFLNSFLCELLCRGESDPEKRGECKKRYCQTRE